MAEFRQKTRETGFRWKGTHADLWLVVQSVFLDSDGRKHTKSIHETLGKERVFANLPTSPEHGVPSTDEYFGYVAETMSLGLLGELRKLRSDRGDSSDRDDIWAWLRVGEDPGSGTGETIWQKRVANVGELREDLERKEEERHRKALRPGTEWDGALSLDDVLEMALEHKSKHGEWPKRGSGPIEGMDGLTWEQVDQGFRSFGGFSFSDVEVRASSLANFIARHLRSQMS